MRTHCLFAVATTCIILSSGCSDPFDPSNLLNGPRMLAMRATPADGVPGETLAIDALIYQHDDTSDPTYAWSWCPIVGSSRDGFPCNVSQATLQQFAGTALIPDYDLGHDPTAALPLNADLTVALRALCDAIDRGIVQNIDSTVVPRCGGRIEISVFLQVQWADVADRGILSIPILLNPDPERNAHPTPGNSDALDLAAGRDVDIQLQLQESDAQPYTQQLIGEDAPQTRYEDLTLTWFITGGDMRFDRTRYVKGNSEFANFTSNTWTTPALADLTNLPSQLILVLRDNRGGIAWWRKQVTFHE